MAVKALIFGVDEIFPMLNPFYDIEDRRGNSDYIRRSAIVGANPAQIIKYRFSDKIIESLLHIKWWDWDIDKIHDNFQYFNRVEEFVEMHDVSL